MTLRPIRTETDYEAALDRAGELMASAPGTPESDELDVLATLIERYEDEQAPVPPADVEAVVDDAVEGGLNARGELGLEHDGVAEVEDTAEEEGVVGAVLHGRVVAFVVEDETGAARA